MARDSLAPRRARLSLIIAAALSLGLAGCGGGSGVKPSPASETPAPPPPGSSAPPPASSSPPPAGSAQPAFDAHLTITDTPAAHDAGYTGAGITIGIVDTGINSDHPALQGRVKKLLVYVDPGASDTSKGDVVGHGTEVSEVAAGKPFGQWPGGIAPQADLVSARIISDKPPADDGSGQGNAVETTDADFFGQSLNPDLIANGVRIQNNSWGGLYWDTSNTDAVGKAFAAAYRPFVIDHGGLVVFATGNDGNAQPSDTASIPHWGADLEQGWLAVAALDTQHPTQLASYSNACGRAMDYCLTAPGNVIVTGANDTAGNPDYYVVQGTSFAAPQVSGAAALVWQAFPYFNNDLVRQTLLGTAKDLGAKGVDSVFGYGLLDVGKAVKGPAQFNWGDVAVSFDGSTSTWGNDISGAGGLVKSGSGTLVLNGHNSYGGTTEVDGGTLKAAFALPSDAMVGAGGTLNSVPGVKGNLDNAGTVVISGADTSVSGNYVQEAGSTLSVSLGSVLKATGTATLKGGDLHVAGANDGYTISTHQDVLTAGGGVTGTFDKLTLANTVFLDTTIQYGANDVFLDTTSLDITSAAAASTTSASAAGAQRVQTSFQAIDTQLGNGAPPPVSGEFLRAAGAIQRASTQRAAQATLESLSGQLHATSAAMTLESMDASQRALGDHFDALLDGRAPDRFGMWSSRLNRSGGMSRGGYQGLAFQMNGTLAGQDLRLGPHSVGGLLVSQSSGLQRISGRLDSNRSRTQQVLGFVGWTRNGWYALGSAGVGSYRQTVQRQLLLGSYTTGVGTSYNGQFSVGHIEGGYRLGPAALHLTPFADVEFAHLRRDGFSEGGGAGFGLQSPAQSMARWQGGVGLKLSRSWQFSQDRALQFDSRVMYRRTLAARGEVFDASFVGIDQSAPLQGVGLSRREMIFGLNMQGRLSARSTLSFGYDRDLGDRSQDSSLTARYRMEL